MNVFVRGAEGFLWRQTFDTYSWSEFEPLGGFHGGTWEACPSSIGAPNLNDFSTLSAPTIASRAAQELSVYVIGDGQLWRKSFSSNAWSNWTPLSFPPGAALIGGLSTRPAAVSSSAGFVDVIAHDTNGFLWRLKDPAGTWARIDGQVAGQGAPAVASMGAGRLDVFVHGTENLLFQNTLWPDGTSTAWLPVGGVFTSAPAAAGDPDGAGLDVIGLGPDHAAAADSSIGDGVWWKAWRPVVGNPRGYTRTDGVDVVVVQSGSSVRELSGGAAGGGAAPSATVLNLSNKGGAVVSAASDVWGYKRSDNVNAVVYRGSDNHIHELGGTSGNWSDADLTHIAGAGLSQGNPEGYKRSDNVSAVVYRGIDDHLHELALVAPSNPPWVHNDLTTISGSQSFMAGDPMSYVRADSRNVVVYRAADGHVHEIALGGGGVGSPPWIDSDLFAASGETVSAAGDPWGYVRADNLSVVIFRAADSKIHEIALVGGAWQHATLPGVAASGNPSGYVRADGKSAVVYRSATDGSIHEVVLNGTWSDVSLNSVTPGSPSATFPGAPFARRTSTPNASRVLYLSNDTTSINDVAELTLPVGGTWFSSEN